MPFTPTDSGVVTFSSMYGFASTEFASPLRHSGSLHRVGRRRRHGGRRALLLRRLAGSPPTGPSDPHRPTSPPLSTTHIPAPGHTPGPVSNRARARLSVAHRPTWSPLNTTHIPAPGHTPGLLSNRACAALGSARAAATSVQVAPRHAPYCLEHSVSLVRPSSCNERTLESVTRHREHPQHWATRPPILGLNAVNNRARATTQPPPVNRRRSAGYRAGGARSGQAPLASPTREIRQRRAGGRVRAYWSWARTPEGRDRACREQPRRRALHSAVQRLGFRRRPHAQGHAGLDRAAPAGRPAAGHT